MITKSILVDIDLHGNNINNANLQKCTCDAPVDNASIVNKEYVDDGFVIIPEVQPINNSLLIWNNGLQGTDLTVNKTGNNISSLYVPLLEDDSLYYALPNASQEALTEADGVLATTHMVNSAISEKVATAFKLYPLISYSTTVDGEVITLAEKLFITIPITAIATGSITSVSLNTKVSIVRGDYDSEYDEWLGFEYAGYIIPGSVTINSNTSDVLLGRLVTDNISVTGYFNVGKNFIENNSVPDGVTYPYNDVAVPSLHTTMQIAKHYVENTIETLNTHNKGYFPTLSALQSAYPTATTGNIAYVGTTYPYAIYSWSGSAWIDSGETGGDATVDVSKFLTAEDYLDEELEDVESTYLPTAGGTITGALEVAEAVITPTIRASNTIRTTGTLYAGGATTLRGTLSVGGKTTLSSDVAINGATTINNVVTVASLVVQDKTNDDILLGDGSTMKVSDIAVPIPITLIGVSNTTEYEDIDV